MRMNSSPKIPRDLLPMKPPAPPIPRFIGKFIFKGGSSPPELPKFPREMEEAEDIVSSIFQTTRGIHSTMQTRREIDRLLREPTRLFPVGRRE